MMMYRPLLLPLFSAVLVSLTMGNPLFAMGLGNVGFFALAPLFIAIYQSSNSRQAILYGFIFALFYSLMSNFWLFFYKGFAWITLGGASLGIALLCMSVSAYIFVLGKQRPIWRVPLVAMVWTIYEIGKSNGFLGFPWGLIAYAPHNWITFTQILDLAGVAGLSFIMAVYNAVIAELCLSWSRFSFSAAQTYLSLAAILTVFTLSYGVGYLSFPVKESRLAKILLIQQNSIPWDAQDHSLQLYQETTETALLQYDQNFDLIVGSEGILPYPYQKNLMFYEILPSSENSFFTFIQRIHSPQLIGTPLENRDGVQNGVALISSEGDVVETYAKRQLVPFAEYNPLLDHPFGYWFFDKVIGYPFSWLPGIENIIFSIPSQQAGHITFGVPICFEDAFGWVGRAFTLDGADLFINVTNDSWSRTVSAETQHLIAARYRTIENRRPMVRATTSGITAYIDSSGRIQNSLPPFVQGALSVEVSLQEQPRYTLYTLAGEWLTWAFILFVHAYLLWYHYWAFGRPSWRTLGLFRRAIYDAEPIAKSQYLTDALQKYD